MHLACNGLSSWFEKKATIVTPSRFLAGVASQQFTTYQLEGGSASWERPAIFSLDAWLGSCWQEARYSSTKVPTLLSAAQERLLWQEIIEQDAPDLFDAASTARLAMTAAKLLEQWQIRPGGELWDDHQDAQYFLKWHKRFRQKCRQENWMTRPEVWRSLPGWLKQGWCDHQLIVFAAFDVVPPALTPVRQSLGLWAAMEPVSRFLPAAAAPAHACETFREELEFTARQARLAFEQSPSLSIGVLIPDLRSHLAEVQRTFENVFYPANSIGLIDGRQLAAEDSVFHIHAAPPLHAAPVIANALLLLELAQDRIPTASATAILRSRYITGAQQERSARALADLTLRRRRDIDVSLRDMEEATRNCPLLTPVWQQIRKVGQGLPLSMDFSAGSEFIGGFLEAAGWPGDVDLNSGEREAVELCTDAVSGLAALALVSGPVPYATAVQRLKGLLAAERLEVGTWSSPIQVLEAADATGLRFDQAFLPGLAEESWPPPEQLSSLIPMAVQRAHGIPGSSRQSIFEARQRLTAGMFEVAPSIDVTFSGRLSPLVEPYVKREAGGLTVWPGNLPIQSYRYADLEELDDTNAPPFEAVEPSRGGTSIIKSQSLCPFRAFAEHRLQSTAPEEACIGFDARDRGSFLHTAMQYVWEALQTQTRLRSTSAEDLKSIVHEAVLRSVREDPSSPFHQLTTSAEWERLENLILKWLDVEQARAQPFTVETLEEKRSYEIPGLRLSLRVDRMDRLADGSVLLIDYKSGKQTASKLDGDRPSEPQLLVYAAATPETVEGVFFGELTPRQPRGVGYGRTLHFEKRMIKKDWDRFIEQAKENVEAIATEFVDGKAAVHPLKGACNYCSQPPFCRINEQSGNEGAEEDDE